MSTRLSEPDSFRCAYCQKPRSETGVEGSYCSERCYYREKGSKALNRVHSDSRICNSCYGQVRDVEPATDRMPDVAIGQQYETPRTVIGVDDFSEDEFRRLEGTRWSCACGAVDPSDDHGDVTRWTEPIFENLYNALVDLWERGGLDEEPSRERFVGSLGERSHELELAVGRSLYASQI